MPASLGTSILGIGTDDRSLEKGLDTAESKAKAFVNRIKNVLGSISLDALSSVFTGGMGIAAKAADGLITKLGQIGLAIQGLKSIADSVSGAIGFLTASNAQLEMTTISFTTLLGTASGAADMIKQLTDFAASTPFELTGLESSTQRLLAFGFGAEEIIPLMTSLGDAISALGGTQENLNSLVYVMGQMRQEANINAGDIMQMVNLGIPALEILAEHYHVTTGEIKEMISKGLVPGTEAVKIFSEGLESRYGGMMAAQSSTFTGMMSNLQDWATQTMIVLTKPFFEPAKKGLAALLAFVQSPAGEAAVNRLAAFIQSGVDKATAAFTAAIPLVQRLWVQLQPVVATLWRFHEAISPIGIALDGLKGYLTGGIGGALEALRTRFLLIETYLRQGLNLALAAARQYGPRLLAWVLEVAQQLAQQVIWWGRALVNWILPYIPILLSNLLALVDMLLNWIVQEAPIIGGQALLWAEQLANWALAAIPGVLAALVVFGLQVLGWIERFAPVLVAAVLSWTAALAGWVIPAIPGVISALVQLGQQVLSWAITNIPMILAGIAIAVGNGIGANLRQPVNALLTIFYSLVNNIERYIVPAFGQMAGIISRQLWPVLNQVVSILANAVIPTWAALAAFLMTTGLSAFLSISQVILTFLQPVFIALGDVIRNDLLPVVNELWDWFAARYLPTVQDLAGAFGDKLAAGIELVGSKLRDAAPTIELMAEKLAPVVEKAIELYQALSPLSIAFDVLKGLLTGGLNGAWDALTQHIIQAGDVFGVDLRPAMETISTVIKTVIIPALESFWTTLTQDVLPNVLPVINTIIQKFGEFGDWVSVNIWPKLQIVFAWIAANIGPIFQSASDTIGTSIVPALQKFFEWVGTWLWPKLQEVFGWIDVHVRPVLETAFGIIADHIIPTIGDFINLLLTQLIPTLGSWWDIIATFLKPILDQLLNIINVYILPAISNLWDFVKTKVIPGFSALASFLQVVVFPILHTLADIFGNTVGKAIGFIMDRVKNLIDFWSTVAKIIDKLVHGDFGGAVKIAWDSLSTLVKGPDMVISGNDNSGAENNAAQVRMQQYMMEHPNYDPIAAGNAHAAGTLNAPGGPSLVGEGKNPELIISPDGSKMIADRPTFLDLIKGSMVLPMLKPVSRGTIGGRPNLSSSVTTNNSKDTNFNLYQTVTPAQAENSAGSFARFKFLYGS